jgi:hypothetical protein
MMTSRQEQSTAEWRAWANHTLFKKLAAAYVSATDQTSRDDLELAITCWQEHDFDDFLPIVNETLQEFGSADARVDIHGTSKYVHATEALLPRASNAGQSLDEQFIVHIDRSVRYLRQTWPWTKKALEELREKNGQAYVDSFVLAACHIMLRHFGYSLKTDRMEDCLADLAFVFSAGNFASKELWGFKLSPLGYLIVSNLTIEQMDTPARALIEGKRDDVEWERVADHCKPLVNFWSNEAVVPSIMEEWPDLEGYGGLDGLAAEEVAFWSSVQAQAEERLSPGEYRKMRKEDEKEESSKRLRQYFFPDTWELLPPLAQQNLITADSLYNSREGRRAGIYNELRLATEAVLEEILWQPYRTWLRERLVKDFKALAPALDERRYGTFLAQMLEQLWRGNDFRQFLGDSFKEKERDRQFILSLQKPLRELLGKRNPPEHPQRGNVKFSEADLRDTYGQFLGIGQEGILPRLLQIKREAQKQGK